jgi:hypothetical protein
LAPTVAAVPGERKGTRSWKTGKALKKAENPLTYGETEGLVGRQGRAEVLETKRENQPVAE